MSSVLVAEPQKATLPKPESSAFEAEFDATTEWFGGPRFVGVRRLSTPRQVP